jgi:hypothetical protein
METLTYAAGWFGVLPVVLMALVTAAITLPPFISLVYGLVAPPRRMPDAVEEEWTGNTSFADARTPEEEARAAA